jgi:hypothetical protein
VKQCDYNEKEKRETERERQDREREFGNLTRKAPTMKQFTKLSKGPILINSQKMHQDNQEKLLDRFFFS